MCKKNRSSPRENIFCSLLKEKWSIIAAVLAIEIVIILCFSLDDMKQLIFGAVSICVCIAAGYLSFCYCGYRVLPSVALAISALMVAIVGCALFTGKDEIWAWKKFTDEKISAFLGSSFLKVSGGSILGATIVAVITEAFKDLYARGYHSDDTEARIANRTFRKLQKNLLPRRVWGRKHKVNFLYCGMAIFTVVGVGLSLLVVIKKEGTALILLEWMLFIAAMLAAFGFATHWFISDSILTRAQFFYLKRNHNIIMHKSYECETETAASRNDYYQVAVNLFFTPCDIKSDEQLYLYPEIDLNGFGCSMRTASDLVTHYDSVHRFHLRAMSSIENEKTADSADGRTGEQQYHELLFARFIYNFLERNRTLHGSPQRNSCGLAETILRAVDYLLEMQKKRWDALATVSIRYEDIRALIVLEVLNFLRYQYADSKECPYKDENKEQLQALLYLEFPYMVEMCLKKRIDIFSKLQILEHPNGTISEYRECVEEYYWNIFEENTKHGSSIGITLEKDALAEVAESFDDFLRHVYKQTNTNGEIYLRRILPTVGLNDAQSIILTTRQAYFPTGESIAKDVPGWSKSRMARQVRQRKLYPSRSFESTDQSCVGPIPKNVRERIKLAKIRWRRLCSKQDSWPMDKAPRLYGKRCGTSYDQAALLTEILFRKGS